MKFEIIFGETELLGNNWRFFNFAGKNTARRAQTKEAYLFRINLRNCQSVCREPIKRTTASARISKSPIAGMNTFMMIHSSSFMFTPIESIIYLYFCGTQTQTLRGTKKITTPLFTTLIGVCPRLYYS